MDENLVDQVWGSSRPVRPREPVKVLGLKFTGKKFEDKLADLRNELEKKKSLGFVVCEYSPDDLVNVVLLELFRRLISEERHAGRDCLAL